MYTVGHSNHTPESFVASLRAHGVVHVVDVRSSPGSFRFPAFNRDALATLLEGSAVKYSWEKILGGRESLEKSLPERLASEPEMVRVLDSVLLLPGPVALMCSEGDWRECHRQHLAHFIVTQRTRRVMHILRDGGLEEHPADHLSLSPQSSGAIAIASAPKKAKKRLQ